MKIQFKNYLKKMVDAPTEEEQLSIKKDFDQFYQTLDAKGKKDFIAFSMDIRNEVKINMKAIVEDSTKSIMFDGKEYRLSDWVTSKTYCNVTSIKLAALSNRIKRGTISREFFLELPELNGLKLIKKTYQFR